MFFFHLHFLENLSWHRIFGWQWFFSVLWIRYSMVFWHHSFWWESTCCIVSCMWCIVFSCYFQRFLFQQFDIICLCLGLLVFILLEIHWASGICRLMFVWLFLSKLGSSQLLFLHMHFQYYVLSLLFLGLLL